MPSPTNLSTHQKIWALLTPTERHSMLVLLGLMLIGMLLETLGVGLVIPALALLTQQDFAQNYPALQSALQTLDNPSQQSLVIGGMLVLVGVYFIKGLFLALLAWQQTRFAFSVQARLSQRLFMVYLRQPYTFHLQRNSAQLIRNVINETGTFTSTGILPAMMLLTESLVLLGLCGLLLVVEPLGAVIVVGILSISTFGFHHITRRHISHWGAARLHHEGLRIQHLQQGLGGAKDLKLLGRETHFLERYHQHNSQSARMGELQATLKQLPRLWLELLAVSGLAILVISMLTQGRALETVLPMLGLFAATAFRLMPSINRILSAIQSLRYGLPVIDVLHTELTLATSEVAYTHSPAIPFHAALKLNRVTYTYPDASEPALKDISLTIGKGESVGFIGTSGAGKSTLVDILLGLLTPDAGEVRVDGSDIHANLRGWQDQIGYVPQSIFLTDDTLRRNVAFGLEEDQIDNGAVTRAIQASQLEEFVTSLPDGLETLVGERGTRLSGGQRQRIGIARALYHNPSVLVLDEATSALDTSTEESVIHAVTALQGSKTIIIVAHRLSAVAFCDRLYRLEHGKIVAEGASTTVLSANKTNSSLHTKEFK
jgi:ABC-type multidrug transport system fused ATPase/permease subunit